MNWNWNLKKENEEIPLCTNRYINSLHRPRRCYDAVLSTGPPFNKCETYVIHEKHHVLHGFRAGPCIGTPGHVLHRSDAARARDYPHATAGSEFYIYNNWNMQWGLHDIASW